MWKIEKSIIKRRSIPSTIGGGTSNARGSFFFVVVFLCEIKMPFDVLGSDKQNKIIGKNNNNQKQKKN